MSAVNVNWLGSAEGESLVHHFYVNYKIALCLFILSGSLCNKCFCFLCILGVLERPSLPPSMEEVTYKIFMIGRAGVGKTSVVARLAGTLESSNYTETNGIRKTNVFWPVKIWDKVVLFKLQFWDTSESSIKKYNHILPACKDKVDGICSVFSFDDTLSFSDIPYLMNTMNTVKENPANIVIGTKFKSWSSCATDEAQIKQFEDKWQVKVIKIDSFCKSSVKSEAFDCSYQLNAICNILWNRDKEFISNLMKQAQ